MELIVNKMEFNVSVQELLKAIGNSNIKSIDDNHSDKMFVKLSNAIILGEPDWNYRVFSLVIVYEKERVKCVILNMLIDPLHSQELWTKVLQEGFLDLELYPATIEDEYLVGTFCLVPIKC